MVDERKRLLPPRLDDTEENGPFTCCCPRTNNKLLAKAAVLATVTLERLAFYSISGNLVLFLNGSKYDWSSYSAVDASFFFLGISSVFYFVGGFIADVRFGRFRTIFAAFIIYAIGYTFFPVLSENKITDDLIDYKKFGCGLKHQSCDTFVFIALAIVGIGTGLVRANIAPFGADQLRGETSENTISFFNWYYWSINVGALISLGCVAYVQQNITDNGFFYGYMAGLTCVVLAQVIFFSGKCTYTYRKPVGSIFVNMWKIFREAWRIKKRRKQQQQQFEHRLDFSRGHGELVPTPKPSNFLDHAKFRYGGSYHDHSVDDIKKFGKIIVVFISLIPYWMLYYQVLLLPILSMAHSGACLTKIIVVFISLIPYWMLYYQIETTFLIQGLHMNLWMDSGFINQSSSCSIKPQTYVVTTDPNNTQSGITVAWLTLFNVIMLIILIPILDKIIYPWIRAKQWNFSMVRRILTGMVFATLAICTAGVVERVRLDSYWGTDNGNNTCCYTQVAQHIQNTTYYASRMSILWQIPQYCLIGLSEVFTSIAGLEFASLVAPRSMKSSVMGLFYFFSGIGSFCGSGLMASFEGTWFFIDTDHGNINCKKGCWFTEGTCHLDYYFFVLAGVQVLGIFLFVFIVKKLKLESDPRLTPASPNHIQQGSNTPRRGGNVSRRTSNVPAGNGSFENTSISDRPTTPLLEPEPSTSDQIADLDSEPNSVDRLAYEPVVKRTIGKDSSGRIGGPAVKQASE